MSSVLTNNSAMVALQNLKAINANMSQTQNQISTGKAIATAKDNSAIWAISKVMDSDVKGFDAISSSLSLGKSTVSTARQAAESITDILTRMKGTIVAAQEGNVDRTKLDADVKADRDQIESIIKAAQFNGLNLIDGSAPGGTDILASLDRQGNGTVVASKISVSSQNLSLETEENTAALGAAASVNVPASVGGAAETATLNVDSTKLNIGDTLQLSIGDTVVNYKVTSDDLAGEANDNNTNIAQNVATAVAGAGITGVTASSTDGEIELSNSSASALTVGAYSGNIGGLDALKTIDVSTEANAETALKDIETLIQTSINAAAAFGSVEGRITTQSDFIGKLSDALTSGVGAMVDADMEETSAKLQALQVQQQLGVQALSIANQAPQALLSLFR